jgi:glycosyltransferase involved in cell wall biosynthesis
MISVITVVRNNALRIESTLRSVIAQKQQGIEYIVVDGASTDGTVEVIKQYKDSIDVFISEKDEGIYDALNKGIEIATGSLIGIVHSGDILLPGVIATIAKVHAETPDAILYGCVKAMDHGELDSVWGWTHKRLVENMIPHPGSFVPKSIYIRYGSYDKTFKVAGDYDAFLRYFKNGVEFKFVDLIVQEFDLNGVSQRTAFDSELNRIRAKYGLADKRTVFERMHEQARDGLRKAMRGFLIVFPFIGKGRMR